MSAKKNLIKDWLERPGKGPASATTSLFDLLVVTWAVPEVRLWERVPKGLTLDRLPNTEGELMAFVQMTCCLCAGRRWSPLSARTGDSFHRSDVRVLVRHDKKPGHYLLRAHLGTEEARWGMRAFARDAEFGRFQFYVTGNPALSQCLRYEVTLRDDDSCTSQLTADALPEPAEGEELLPAVPPFASGKEMVGFFLDRQESYYAGSIGGTGVVPFTQSEFVVAPMQLVTVKAPWLVQEGILTAEEALVPLATLYVPQVMTTVYPPRSANLDV